MHMPDFGIVDTHLHLWDPRRLSYGWQRGYDLLARPYLIEDYSVACGHIDVAAMVFVECLVDRGLFEAEIRFVEEQALSDPRIKAIVAQVSLEEGAAVLPYLEHLKATTPLLRGIRRIVEFEPELDFCLRPAFIEGVKLLRCLGLSFEITVNYRHMEPVLRFVDRVGEIPLMLDHCGKPGIREGRLEPWRAQMRALATYPNVMCKLSDLPVEADHRDWTEAQIRPYIDAAAEAFGFKRLVYGGDWPVCLQATAISDWVGLLDRSFSGVHPRYLAQFYRDNAVDFYRLELPPLNAHP
jgi:L-fuconolactonase